MRTQTIHRDMAAVARRLHDDHLAFEKRFDALRNCAEVATWRELDADWSAFVRDVEIENARIYPWLEREGRHEETAAAPGAAKE